MKTNKTAESELVRKNPQTVKEKRKSELLMPTGIGLKADATKDTLSLAPDLNFHDAQKQALSAVSVLDVATTAITVQPDFKDLEGVENLKEHQVASKSDANTWRNDVRPTLFSVNDAIINYNTEFGNLYDPLYEFAGQLQDPQKCADAQSNLVAGLQNLQGVLKVQKDRVDLAAEKINGLRESMLTHESALNGDLTEIKAKYEGDKGRLAATENKITAYDTAMSRDLTIIGSGATGVVVGGLTVAVGVALWLESAGGSTPVIVVGVGVIVAGGAAAGYGIYDYNKSSDSKAAAIRELSTINAEIAVAKLLTTDVSTLVTHLDTASEALKKLSDGWGQLDRDYQNIIEALENTQGNAEKTKPLAFIVQANLRTSKQQWDTLVNDANTIKQNLLSPMAVDTSSLDNSDGKNPARPNAPLGPEKKLMAAHTFLAVSAPKQPVVKIQDTGYRLWVENTAKAVFSFESDMNNLITKGTAPAKVVEANNNLTAIAHPAIDATNDFIAATEDLSKEASVLRTTAKLGDDAIVTAAVKVFEEVAAKVVTARENGQTASDKVSKLESSVATVDAALSGWLSDMKAEQAYDQDKLDDATRLREKAQRDKENIKNDYWYCLLGPVACAVVAIEATERIKNAQSEINAYNSKIPTLDKSLSDLLTSINDTTSLTGNAVALSKSIDGGLTALQVIKSAVDGINADIHNLAPFIVRAHLNAVADQIEGVATVRLTHSSRMLFKVMAVVDDKSFIDILQTIASPAMMVQFSALMSSKQPKLVYVENLLKQDQALLLGHTLEWTITYSNNVLSEFSAIRALGDGIQYLGHDVLELAVKGEIANATAGIDSIIDSFSALMENRLLHDTLGIQLFNENIKNDQNCFNTVADVLRTQLGGSSGELATMEAKESAYTVAITQSLSDIVNDSTRIVCEHLAWGVVLAVTVGTGQIEFAGAAAPTVMYLVKKGANLGIKAASEAGAAQAKAELKKIERKGDDIDTLVSERSNNLEKICELNADMAILKVLIDDVSNMKENSAAILKVLGDIKGRLQSEIHNFYTIKYDLKSSTPSEGIEKLKTALEAWEDISTASDLLEKSFMVSFSS